MPNTMFPTGFDPTRCILFLGAGFSMSAKNLIDSYPPNALGLEKEIKRLAELPENERSSLVDLSTYAVKKNKDLFNLLCNLYTVKSLSRDQEIILKQPWLRIYTTNYDDAVECFWKLNNIKFESYSTEDQFPKKIHSSAIIHLHGYIHKCDKRNLLSQLVLNHYSYAQQHTIRSPWWGLFEKDINVSTNIFFLGYELNDFEPAKYLTINPKSVEKTHFILLPTDSPVQAARLDDYGKRHSMGVLGFAEECKLCEIGKRPKHSNELSTFNFFDIHKDNKSPVRPSVTEIEALFAFGKFLIQRLLATFPNSEYILTRTSKIDECVQKLSSSKTLIVHSNIGNGKTVFRQGLNLALSKNSSSCFELRENVTPSCLEINYISDQPNPIITFSDYESAYSNIHLFSDLDQNAKFILEIRTGTLQVRYTEVTNILPKPIETVDLNRLSSDELEAFYKLLDNAGIAPNDFKQRFNQSAQIRDIVLHLFKNEDIKKRIEDVILPILINVEAKKVIFTSLILKYLGANTEHGFIHSVFGLDPYKILNENKESAFEFLDFTFHDIEPHSTIFSEFLITNYLNEGDFIDLVYDIASEAADRMNESGDPQSERHRQARTILGSVIRYSFLIRMLDKSDQKKIYIEKIYDKGRHNNNINKEPLFWLQYSIFMQNLGDNFKLAEDFMNTAYNRAADRPEFMTYQLDTNALKLFLLLEQKNDKNSPVKRAQRIHELLLKSLNMIGDGNHRKHTFKVLELFEQFIAQRNTGLEKQERNMYVYVLNLIIKRLEQFTLQEKAEWGSEPVKNSLQNAIAIMVKYN